MLISRTHLSDTNGSRETSVPKEMDLITDNPSDSTFLSDTPHHMVEK